MTRSPVGATSDRPRHVVLLGLMGAGKTTTARALARHLGWPVRDNDEDLEAGTGRTGAQIAATEGVARLHALEAELLVAALTGPVATVIAAAGSVVDAADARRAIATRATAVWLDAPADTLTVRAATGTHRRSMADAEVVARGRARLARLEAVCDLRLDARLPTGELVDAICRHLGATPRS